MIKLLVQKLPDNQIFHAEDSYFSQLRCSLGAGLLGYDSMLWALGASMIIGSSVLPQLAGILGYKTSPPPLLPTSTKEAAKSHHWATQHINTKFLLLERHLDATRIPINSAFRGSVLEGERDIEPRHQLGTTCCTRLYVATPAIYWW